MYPPFPGGVPFLHINKFIDLAYLEFVVYYLKIQSGGDVLFSHAKKGWWVDEKKKLWFSSNEKEHGYENKE